MVNAHKVKLYYMYKAIPIKFLHLDYISGQLKLEGWPHDALIFYTLLIDEA